MKERNSNKINDDINGENFISLFKRKSSENENIQIIKKKKSNKKLNFNNTLNHDVPAYQ